MYITLPRLERQCHILKPVGDQIYPQHLRRKKGKLQPHEQRCDNGNGYSRACRKKKERNFPDVVEYHPPHFDCLEYGLEIVVSQHHIRRFTRHIGPHFSHGNADIRLF